jgi:hypothetical protein
MRRLLLPLLAAALSCAADRPLRRPVHGAFAGASFDATWDRALEVLRAEGYEIGLADRARGILMTGERELQAPCGEAQCLSRESVFLRLAPSGQATLSIRRSRWNPAEGAFGEGTDRRSVEATERDQQALLAAITRGSTELRLARRGESCGADAECERGLACQARKCGR